MITDYGDYADHGYMTVQHCHRKIYSRYLKWAGVCLLAGLVIASGSRFASAVMGQPYNIFWRAGQSEVRKVESVPLLKQFMTENSTVFESRLSGSLLWNLNGQSDGTISELLIVRIAGDHCAAGLCPTAFFSDSPTIRNFLGSAWLTPVATMTDTIRSPCGKCEPGPLLLFYDDTRLIAAIHISVKGIFFIPPV